LDFWALVFAQVMEIVGLAAILRLKESESRKSKFFFCSLFLSAFPKLWIANSQIQSDTIQRPKVKNQKSLFG
jgi:hypothetical protein